MKIQEQIDERLKQIYENFKNDKEDLTGWSINQKLKEEADFNEELLDYFCYRIMKIAYENNEIILLLLNEFLLYPFFNEEYSPRNPKEKGKIEIFPEISFKKGIKFNILEKLNFNETLKTYSYYLICQEEEINKKDYLSDEQILNFSSWEKASERIMDVLNKELKEKFGENFEDRPKIYKFD